MDMLVMTLHACEVDCKQWFYILMMFYLKVCLRIGLHTGTIEQKARFFAMSFETTMVMQLLLKGRNMFHKRKRSICQRKLKR